MNNIPINSIHTANNTNINTNTKVSNNKLKFAKDTNDHIIHNTNYNKKANNSNTNNNFINLKY